MSLQGIEVAERLQHDRYEDFEDFHRRWEASGWQDTTVVEWPAPYDQNHDLFLALAEERTFWTKGAQMASNLEAMSKPIERAPDVYGDIEDRPYPTPHARNIPALTADMPGSHPPYRSDDYYRAPEPSDPLK